VTTPVLEIDGRRIGPGHPTFVIAELSGNHGHDLDRTRRLVVAAKEAGADAVKLQTYTADTLTLRSDLPHFRLQGTVWQGRTLHDLYAEACTPWDWHAELMALAHSLGMVCFSTPFDPTAVAFLETLDVPAYKVASFEIVDLPLIQCMAQTGKPLILSTGMATLAEVDAAVTAARQAGCRQLALLKCCSAYPAPAEAMHLRTIPHLAASFAAVSGLSDHTLDLAVPVAAVTLGAAIVEKHLTLSRQEPGPDAAFSLEPDEFRSMVQAVRTAEAALGSIHYGVDPHEAASLVFRRSLFAVADIRAGEALTSANVRSIRPGNGLPPRHLPAVLGRLARQDIPAGTPLDWSLLK
jgi:N-acetylneuraminate synthase